MKLWKAEEVPLKFRDGKLAVQIVNTAEETVKSDATLPIRVKIPEGTGMASPATFTTSFMLETWVSMMASSVDQVMLKFQLNAPGLGLTSGRPAAGVETSLRSVRLNELTTFHLVSATEGFTVALVGIVNLFELKAEC